MYIFKFKYNVQDYICFKPIIQQPIQYDGLWIVTVLDFYQTKNTFLKLLVWIILTQVTSAAENNKETEFIWWLQCFQSINHYTCIKISNEVIIIECTCKLNNFNLYILLKISWQYAEIHYELKHFYLIMCQIPALHKYDQNSHLGT